MLRQAEVLEAGLKRRAQRGDFLPRFQIFAGPGQVVARETEDLSVLPQGSHMQPPQAGCDSHNRFALFGPEHADNRRIGRGFIRFGGRAEQCDLIQPESIIDEFPEHIARVAEGSQHRGVTVPVEANDPELLAEAKSIERLGRRHNARAG